MAISDRIAPAFSLFPRLASVVPLRPSRLANALFVGATLLFGGSCLTNQVKAADAAPERRICIAKADGTELRLLSEELSEYDPQGSPDWSQDGKLIALDAWRSGRGEGVSDARIIVVEADGENPRDLIDGAMPSFSPRAQRIAFSRYAPNRGVWVMNSAGPEKGLALIDESGWCAVWSPDGRKIAYIKSTGQGANLVIFNVIEGTRHPVFDEIPSPYSQIYWNFAWSPDSKQIVFNASKNGKKEVAIVDVRGARHGLTTRLRENLRTSFSWRPDGKRILFCNHHPERGSTQLFLLDPKTEAPAELLLGQNPKWRHVDTSYSPDGTKIAVSIHLPKNARP